MRLSRSSPDSAPEIEVLTVLRLRYSSDAMRAEQIVQAAIETPAEFGYADSTTPTPSTSRA